VLDVSQSRINSNNPSRHRRLYGRSVIKAIPSIGDLWGERRASIVAYTETQPLTSLCLASSCYVPPPRRWLVNAGILRFNGTVSWLIKRRRQTSSGFGHAPLGPTTERESEGGLTSLRVSSTRFRRRSFIYPRSTGLGLVSTQSYLQTSNRGELHDAKGRLWRTHMQNVLSEFRLK
jgi:hypothetical protein